MIIIQEISAMTEEKIKEHMINLNRHPRIGNIMRKKHHLTFKALAELFINHPGMSCKSLMRYEAGTADCPASVLYALSKYYNCTIDDLYDDDIYINQINSDKKTVYRYTPYLYSIHEMGPLLVQNKNYNGYRTDDGLDFYHGKYDIIELKTADHSLGLPKGAKILFNHSEYMDYNLNEDEKIFIVELSPKEITKFPEFHISRVNKRGRLLFITKAKVLPNTYQPKTVLFYYNNEIKNINYQLFSRRIKGVAVKIIIDY